MVAMFCAGRWIVGEQVYPRRTLSQIDWLLILVAIVACLWFFVRRTGQMVPVPSAPPIR